MSRQFSNTKAHALAVAAVLLGGTVLAACGSSSSNTTTSTVKKSSSALQKLQALTGKANSGKAATFKATWTSTSNGTKQTITLEQSPPKVKFSTSGSGFVLDDGTTTYFCSSSTSCLKESSSTDPLAGILDLYNGSTFLSTVSAYSSRAILEAEGISLNYSSASYAGVASSCVSITVHSSSTAKWCVSNQGVLTYWSSGSDTFALTSYSSSVPASDLKLPTGATVITIP